MNFTRKHSGESAQGGSGLTGRFVTVGLPLPYEGVGRALRATYSPAVESLPDDMLALLDKLR